MGRRAVSTRLIAMVLILGIAGIGSPFSFAASADASIRGVVHSATSREPVAGARLYAADRSTGEVFQSGTTDKTGAFSIGSLPSSTYELAVESNQGLYLVGTPLNLAPGEAQQVDLAVNDSKGKNPAKGNPATAGRTVGLWNNPLTAALIVLGSALVVGVIVEETTEDDDPASPF